MVEVMVTIAILITLMTLMALGVARAWENANVQLTQLTIGKVAGEVIMHRAVHGELPSQADGLAVVYPGEPIPQDAWKGDLQYEHQRLDFDVVSLGKDGAPGGTGFATDLRR